MLIPHWESIGFFEFQLRGRSRGLGKSIYRNETEQQENSPQFRYKTTFDDPTKHTSSTFSNQNPIYGALKTLVLQRKIVEALISNQKITIGERFSNLIFVSPIHLVEIVDNALPTNIRIITRNILSSCVSAYALIRKIDV
jgi:hypothetical protein